MNFKFTFNQQIDNFDEYREPWFDFKKKRYVQWIKEQIADYNKYFL